MARKRTASITNPAAVKAVAKVFADRQRNPAVDHPDHYNGNPSSVECIDVVEHMSFNVGNAMKYLWRAGSKGDAVEDLKKARWYVEREIERLGRRTS